MTLSMDSLYGDEEYDHCPIYICRMLHGATVRRARSTHVSTTHVGRLLSREDVHVSTTHVGREP